MPDPKRGPAAPPYSGRVLGWMEEHQAWLWAAGVASLVIIVASAVALPSVVARIPADYFAHPHRPLGLWERRTGAHWRALRWTIRIGKNVLGVLMMLAGAAMLFLPGQGLLTIVVGFLLIDFPGKYGLEKRLVRIGWVRRGIDWLRRRRGAEGLVVEKHAEATKRRSDDVGNATAAAQRQHEGAETRGDAG